MWNKNHSQTLTPHRTHVLEAITVAMLKRCCFTPVVSSFKASLMPCKLLRYVRQARTVSRLPTLMTRALVHEP